MTSDHGDNQPQGGEVVVTHPSELQALSLDVYSDHSIIEAFAQGGRAAVTSRVYPVTGLLLSGGCHQQYSRNFFGTNSEIACGSR